MTVEMDGICRPSHWHIPPRAGSYLKAVEGVAEKLGRTLDPTQRFAVDVLTSSKDDGSPAALAAAVVCPRQNLKTYILELITLTRLLRPGGDQLAVWSAHEVSTAQETFRQFAEYAEAEDERGRPVYPWFAERVVSISRATGRESITFRRKLPSGRYEKCRLKFKARVKTGGRGLAGDLVVLDEAFALEPAHMGSLLPILSTKAKGQILYGSSAPHAKSMILHDVVKRGRSGLLPYVEWSAPGTLAEPGCLTRGCSHEVGTPGCVLDDVEMAVANNPAAFHGRISRSYLVSERLELRAAPEEYARERYGWAEDATAGSVPVSPARWGMLADPAGTWDGQFVVAFDVSMGSKSSSVAVAGIREDGRPQLEVIRTGPGTAWLPEFVATVAGQHGGAATVVANNYPTCEALFPPLAALGVTVHPFGLGDFAAACAWLEQAVNDGAVAHLGDETLMTALKGAATAAVGDGAWRWVRKSSDVDISPLVAVTLAGHGLRSMPAVDLDFFFV